MKRNLDQPDCKSPCMNDADFTFDFRQIVVSETAVVVFIVVVIISVTIPTVLIAAQMSTHNETLAVTIATLILFLLVGAIVVAIWRLMIPMTIGVANQGLLWLNRRTGIQRTIPWDQVTRHVTDYFGYNSSEWLRLRLWFDGGRTRLSIQVDAKNQEQLERFAALRHEILRRLGPGNNADG